MSHFAITIRHLSERSKMIMNKMTSSRTRRYVSSVLILFVCFGYWSIATPMFAVPDEPAHLVRAYGISTGDFSGQRQTDGEPIYKVPKILTTEICFARNPDQTADCLNFPTSNEEVLTTSSAASYPPLSHIIFSIPFFFGNGLSSLYLSRLVGALICALLFALGLDSLSRSSRSLALSVGVSLGLTPMVMLSCATVNPSGMAIAAAFAAWAGGLAISKSDKKLIDTKMVMSLMIPLVIYLAIRRDSMLWGVAIMACLLILTSWSTILHLLKKLSMLLFIGLLGAELLLQLFVWGGQGGQGLTESGPMLGGTQSGNAHAAFGSLPNYLYEAIGKLGWLDTPIPLFVYIFWQALFVGIFFLSMSTAKFRLRISMLFAFLVFMVLPIKVGSVTFPYFQGRYALPLLIGTPLLATYSQVNSQESILGSVRSTRFITIMIWLMGVASFTESMRRYTVGLSSGWSALLNPRWNPPVFSAHFLLATYPMIFLILTMWLLRLFSNNQFIEERTFF